MKQQYQKLSAYLASLRNIRMLAMLILGFASGLPLALSGSTLQAWFTVAGISYKQIGLLSLVGIPYTFKFLWAGFLDQFQLPGFTRRKGWIIAMQVLLAIVLALMAFQKAQINALTLAALALALAFLSATQDMAIDAHRVDLMSTAELPSASALYTLGYRIAMLLSGGIALLMAAYVGWRITYLSMSVLLLACAAFTLKTPENPRQNTIKSLTEAFVLPFKNFLQRPHAWILLFFILIYKFGDAFTVSFSTTFFLRKVGLTLAEVGVYSKSFGLVATLIGISLGAWWTSRLGIVRALFIFGFAQMASNALFLLVAVIGKSYFWVIFTIVAENFTAGLSTTAFLAFLASICDARFSASQFALLSALAAVGRVWVGPLAAFTIDHIGWIGFFVTGLILTLPAILYALCLPKWYEPHLAAI